MRQETSIPVGAGHSRCTDTTSAAQLFATHTGLGRPQDHMFSRAPAAQDWQEQLSGQTRLTVSPEEALQVVRSAWSAARS